MTIEEILAFDEMQIFDRKSINIDPKALAVTLVAFANADGGTVAIGISDKTRRIEGTDDNVLQMNELLRVPYDFCEPTVQAAIEKVPCIDFNGRNNHVLLMHIEPSPHVHANQADEVYLRVGDKSKKLEFNDRLQLTYDKGERFFEDKPVPGACIDDLDIEFVEEYTRKIGYRKSAQEFLMENRGFVKLRDGKMQVSTAAVLLFARKPQDFFPRARVRFIRYEGIEEKFGAEMNVVKDVIFEGNVLKMITDSIAYLSTQIKEKTYLGKDGLFVTEEEYPKFVRQEIIVNAVTHRAYSISGTDIQIKMFDNRIVVESPGKLPGLVRADNIRHTHFSRNPKIAEFLRAFDFVKEYGEGVDRMCQEMEAKGLQGPEYCTNVFLLQAVIYNSAFEKETDLSDNLAFEAENSAIQNKKLAFGYQKTAFGNKKLAIETLNSIIEVQHYNEPTKANIILVYNMIEANQVFGAPEVKDILKCSASSSKDIMKKLRDMEVVVTVKGKGKGKYRFVYDKEMKQ